MIPKFRGKSMLPLKDLINAGIRYKGNRWVEGYLIQEGNDSYIINGVIEANSQYITIGEWIPVFTDSVGQATGLQDKNGVDIYEGDIIRVVGAVENLDYDWGVVKFETGAFVIDYYNLDTEFDSFVTVSLPIEVIGNIYENPNLLEEEE